ncbi:serine hydrolase-like protein [Galleria mellonella]|uniref:Serine hydrolase-like protein n=1 Tax=Galleria mellonella TaxID=7137 RepID=A0ABM3MUJ4_GALME|nr:serine hydrolase-like protein [Galleria mellonella]
MQIKPNSIMKEPNKEWFINAPWGKIAMISWGNPDGEPVLLVHGRSDSVATFIPLLELLPDNYHYVGADLPGNGKSDPFPVGVTLCRIHFLGALEVIVNHLKWDQFTYIGHSNGCDQGLFYNVIYPGRVKKFILLDGSMAMQRLQIHNMSEYFDAFYAEYYDNYKKYNVDDRVYTKKRAIDAVIRARGLDVEKAEIALSRSLKCISDDQYKLSWDRRLRFPAPQNYSPDYYYQLFSRNSPPTLHIQCTLSQGYLPGKAHVEKLLSDLSKNMQHFVLVTVEGDHDVHLTNPDRIIGYIKDFLNRDFKKEKCKL